MLNISPPFTVSRIAKGLTRDALCANGVNRHNVGTVSESPSASSWMKCIQNIIDALDHFRKVCSPLEKKFSLNAYVDLRLFEGVSLR